MTSRYGKVIGNYQESSVLGLYKLELRYDMDREIFIVLVPASPDSKVVVRDSKSFAVVKGKTAEEVKGAVRALIHERDVTDFRDVIEYQLMTEGVRDDDCVGLSFRVARISTVMWKGSFSSQPRLEIDVHVVDGKVEPHTVDGEPVGPHNYVNHHFDQRMPFMSERWRKLEAIRAGISDLKRRLTELLGEEGDAPVKLDLLAADMRALLGPVGEKEE